MFPSKLTFQNKGEDVCKSHFEKKTLMSVTTNLNINQFTQSDFYSILLLKKTNRKNVTSPPRYPNTR